MAPTALTMLPSNRADMLRNATCVYCGRDLETTGYTKEHVIGRRFVPRGSLDACWNLIVRACPACNGEKSDLEDDISALTLAYGASRPLVKADPLFAADLDRKTRGSISRQTGRAVAVSGETIEIRTALWSNVVLTARMSSPPRVDHERVFALAHLQIRAFFYRISYRSDTSTGRQWPGMFVPVMLAPQSNWGEPVIVEFSRATRSWPYRLIGVTANGYFKVSIRKHPEEGAACWAWALEWNQSFRVVGFFGMLEPPMAEAWSFEERLKRMVTRHPEGFLALGLEKPVESKDDTLFALAGETEEGL